MSFYSILEMLLFSIGSAYFVTGSYPPEALAVSRDIKNALNNDSEHSYKPPTIVTTTAPISSGPSYSQLRTNDDRRYDDRIGLLGES